MMGSFSWKGGGKISSELFQIPPIQKPKNTKNQKPKVQDLGTQGKSSFQETLLETYKRAQIKNSGFVKERVRSTLKTPKAEYFDSQDFAGGNSD